MSQPPIDTQRRSKQLTIDREGQAQAATECLVLRAPPLRLFLRKHPVIGALGTVPAPSRGG